MKLETIKSLILFIMIGISLLLSYTLWSYQPNSEQMIGGEIVEEEMNAGGSDQETKRSLIKPTDIIFHTESGYYGFRDVQDIDEMYTQMQEWVLTNFERFDGGFPRNHEIEKQIELIFADEIPMEILGSLFSFGKDDIQLPNWSIKRMYIHFIEDSKSLQVEFASDQSENIATALVSDTAVYEELLHRLEQLDRDMFREYLVINEGQKPIYIPAGRMVLPTYSITPLEIKPELFVNVLFTNPAVVRETVSQTIGKVYFTDNRQMNVYYDGMRMEYVSHVASPSDDLGDRELTAAELIDRSIMAINSHSGWTGDFRLEDINWNINQVTFQLYYRGYPLFSSYKLATIQQRWDVYQNNVQLVEYDRPLYRFASEFILREVDNLPTGERVVSYLETNPDIVLENVEDIMIGYELQYQREDEESDYIELSPAWYKKESNVWQKLVLKEEMNATPRGGD